MLSKTMLPNMQTGNGHDWLAFGVFVIAQNIVSCFRNCRNFLRSVYSI